MLSWRAWYALLHLEILWLTHPRKILSGLDWVERVGKEWAGKEFSSHWSGARTAHMWTTGGTFPNRANGVSAGRKLGAYPDSHGLRHSKWQGAAGRGSQEQESLRNPWKHQLKYEFWLSSCRPEDPGFGWQQYISHTRIYSVSLLPFLWGQTWRIKALLASVQRRLASIFLPPGGFWPTARENAQQNSSEI
jgi:hypothetical protein